MNVDVDVVIIFFAVLRFENLLYFYPPEFACKSGVIPVL